MPSTQIPTLADPPPAPVEGISTAADPTGVNAYAHAANLILDGVLAHLASIQTRFRLSDKQAYAVLQTALNEYFQQRQ